MTREGSIDAFPKSFGAKVNFYQETKFEKGLQSNGGLLLNGDALVQEIFEKVCLYDAASYTEIEIDIDDSLEYNKLFSLDKDFKIPLNAEISEKYWLKNTPEFGSYIIEDQRLVGEPDNKPTLEAKFIFRINGQQITYNSPVIYKINSPINGDEYRPFNIGNPIYLNPVNNLEYFVNTNKKQLEVEVISGTDNLNARVYLDVTEDIKVEPEFFDIDFKNKDERKILKFDVSLSGTKNSISNISYKAKIDDKVFSRGKQKIIYSHISQQTRSVSYTHLTLPTILLV